MFIGMKFAPFYFLSFYCGTSHRKQKFTHGTGGIRPLTLLGGRQGGMVVKPRGS
jgi:hypothetical protein